MLLQLLRKTGGHFPSRPRDSSHLTLGVALGHGQFHSTFCRQANTSSAHRTNPSIESQCFLAVGNIPAILKKNCGLQSHHLNDEHSDMQIAVECIAICQESGQECNLQVWIAHRRSPSSLRFVSGAKALNSGLPKYGKRHYRARIIEVSI